MDYFSRAGYRPSYSAPLVIPELSTTFVLSVGLLQLKAVLTPHAQSTHFEDFCMVQRCLRQFDIVNSGYTNHLSFFEMAGAISSGDRSQTEVIHNLVEFLTREIGFDINRLVFTVFGGGEFMGRKIPADESSQRSLSDLGISPSQIHICGVNSNFFGNTERDIAYGPSLEIYIDRGSKSSCPIDNTPQPDCLPQRYVEIGTCVFLKYLRDDESLREMPRAFCEAGIGVERVSFVSSGLSHIYELTPLRDVSAFLETHCLLSPILQRDQKCQADICSDYLRAVTFAIADGAKPGGSGGRQHVMRSLTRRLLARLDWKTDVLIDVLPDLLSLVAERNRHVSNLPESMINTVCKIIISEIELFRKNINSDKINLNSYLTGPEI